IRILVIGNANAGKTTILEKVCHARGHEPVYLNRGNHEIEHQFQYPTAHGFVFHDSCGFEAGGAVELQKVKNFIEKKAKAVQLKDRLHAIWCAEIPNDRGMASAEMSLFESGTGNVPVIAIFTKMDALDQVARNQLMWNNDNLSPEEIEKQVPDLAEEIFQKKYLGRLDEVNHKPRYVVRLRDMNKEGTNCDELIAITSQTLDRDTKTVLSARDVTGSILRLIATCFFPLVSIFLLFYIII
ncbi:hypothetical protein BU17DRAFT_52003, partial [Hysterangium stoloniferum]